MTPSKALFWLCVSFVVGIAVASLINIPQMVVWGILVLGIMCIAASFFKKEAAIIGFCLLFLVLGVARFQTAELTIAQSALTKLNDQPEKITLTGQIVQEPDVRDTQQKLTVKVKGGLVLVTVRKFPEYHYLDTLQVTGKLKTPAVFDDFNYKNYLLKDGVYSVMDYPNVQLVLQIHQYNPFTYVYEKILFIKGRMQDSINANFSPPDNLLLQGIVLGDNKNMTTPLRNKLNASGLRYLTAISGLHVIIISAMLMSLLLALGFWRQHACYASIGFVWLYVILTGLSASGVRAAIMGSIFLLAQALGRQNTSSRTITLAVALMLLQNPMLLLYDVGFQLSFLASLGIIYGKPVIEIFLRALSKDRLKNFIGIISVTLTAQLFTLPIMMYNFGSISLVAPITNMLILPMFYWLLMVGFVMALAGIFSSVLGFIIALPCWALLTYFMKVMDIFSQPWAAKTIPNISWVWVVAYYVILAVAIWYLHKSKKPEFLGY